MKLYTGHLAYHGLDVLLTVHPDGTHELATRPGSGERWVRWSPPVALTPEPTEATS